MLKRCPLCLLAATGLLVFASAGALTGMAEQGGDAVATRTEDATRGAKGATLDAEGATREAKGSGDPKASAFPPAGSRVRVHGRAKPLAPGVVTSDWASFFGPNHDLTSPETGLLKTLPAAGLKLVWEIERGTGYASPAVSGDRLVLFHRFGGVEVVECFHRETGEHFWSYSYPSAYKDRYDFNNGPRSSPVIDGGLVFTHGAEGTLHCLDLQTGKVFWHRDTTKEHKITRTYFGVGSTPLVEGELLIVQVGAPPGGPCVVAYDKKTGKEVWRAGDQWQASYASPIPAMIHGQRRILVFAGGDIDPPTGGLLVIDPKTGAIATRFPFRSRNYVSVNVANPTVIGDSVFLSTSYRTGCVLVDLKPDGAHAVAWKSKALEAHFATAIHVDGFLYGLDGGNRFRTGLTCVDAKSGERVWKELPDWSASGDVDGSGRTVPAGPFQGSMIHVDGSFLILGEQGHLAWAELSPHGYKELSRTRLFNAKETWTPPVISRGLLYICQNTPDAKSGAARRLLCYDFRAGS